MFATTQESDAFFPILRQVGSLAEAMDKENAKRNMEETVEQVFRVLRMGEAEVISRAKILTSPS